MILHIDFDDYVYIYMFCGEYSICFFFMWVHVVIFVLDNEFYKDDRSFSNLLPAYNWSTWV